MDIEAKFVNYFFLMIALFSSSACLKQPYFPGKDPGQLHLKISLVEKEKISVRAVASEIRRLGVCLTNKKLQVNKEVSYNGGEQIISFDSLYPGFWTIEVFGIDRENDPIFYGKKTREILPGEKAELSMIINPGPGRLEVTIEISELRDLGVDVSEGKIYVYLDPNTNLSTSFSLILEENYLKNEKEIKIPEGTYQARINIPQKSNAVYESHYETVTIRAGKLTELYLQADAKLMIEGKIDSTPATPENFRVTCEEKNKPLLTWDPVQESDLDGYCLYRTNNEGRFILLKQVDKNTFLYQDTIEDKDYFNDIIGYAVSSVDQGENVSFWSEPVYLTYSN